MKQITWTALVLLALWQALFGATPAPAPPPHTGTLAGDCGSFIDPTGGCGH